MATASATENAYNFRRTIIRYETTLARYTGWIHLACLILTLRRF